MCYIQLRSQIAQLVHHLEPRLDFQLTIFLMVKLLLAQRRGVERMLQVSTRNVKTITLQRLLLLHHRSFLIQDGPAMARMLVILHDVHGGVCFMCVGFTAVEGNPRHIILSPLLEETCFLFEGANDGIWHILISRKQRS